MTQDVIVTVIVFATAALFGIRWWRRRGKAEPACASCESNTPKGSNAAAATVQPSDAKPVAFYGAAPRKK